MANKPNAEEITHRVHKGARWVLLVLIGSLVWHATEQPDGSTTGIFIVHAAATVGVGVCAALVWCTRNLLRALRKLREDMRKHDKRIVTPDDVKRMMREAYDEGQITGLATGLADLSRSAQGGKPGEN